MSERYITLLGAEQVDNAARRMRGAADEMQRAANNLAYALQRHETYLEDWLQRFTAALETSEKKL